ncbi:MAG: histidine phosphatase family protein [Candidatus Pacebacteria bacterium]|nr:histidine phosphatase family protein [Candidatus Paceibacterota bacterium]
MNAETINFEDTIENGRENEPFSADSRVDFVRHGKPEYTEEEIETGKYEGELNDESKENVRRSAENFARNINKEKEIIVFLTSPRNRAKETAEIYKDVFEKEEIFIYEEMITKATLLRNTELNADFLDNQEEAVNSGEISWDDWMEFWVDESEKEKLSEGVESPDEVRERVGKFIGLLKDSDILIRPPKNKKVHYICIGHEEIVRDLLEEGYDTGIAKGTNLDYGEKLRMDIYKSQSNKNASLKLEYKSNESTLDFDATEKKFEKHKDNN